MMELSFLLGLLGYLSPTLAIVGAFIGYVHDYNIIAYPSLHGHKSYWLPLTEARRVHNRRRRIQRELQGYSRRAHYCQMLAEEYKSEGNEINAAVLLVEAEDALRRHALIEARLRDFDRERVLAQREAAFCLLTKDDQRMRWHQRVRWQANKWVKNKAYKGTLKLPHGVAQTDRKHVLKKV